MLSFDPDDTGYLRELAEFVAVPSVSRDASPDTMRAAAHWLAGQLAFAGGRVVEPDGHPVVRGEWLHAAGAPTVLVYGHYDVQPTGAAAEWRTPPFELTVDGDVARGRGVTDDKGPVYIVAEDGPGVPGPGGRPAAQRQVPVRGRGGDRQPAPARVPPRARRGAGGGPGHLRGRRDVAADRAVARAGLQGPRLDGHHRRRREHGSAFWAVRRDGGQPAARAQRDTGQPAPPGWHRRRAGFLRRHPQAQRGAAAGDRQGLF